MQFVKVKFLKNGYAAGRAYTYRSPEEVFPGDKVELPGGKHGIVVDELVDADWIKAYGAENLKEISGKVEEAENNGK